MSPVRWDKWQFRATDIIIEAVTRKPRCRIGGSSHPLFRSDKLQKKLMSSPEYYSDSNKPDYWHTWKYEYKNLQKSSVVLSHEYPW